MTFSRAEVFERSNHPSNKELEDAFKENYSKLSKSKPASLADYILGNHKDKRDIKGMVDSLAERTGLKQYLNQLQAKDQIEVKASEPTSLLDFDYIRNAIDKAVTNYTSWVGLVTDLQPIVSKDNDVPIELKNVMGDERLVAYIKERLGNSAKRDNKPEYDSLVKDPQQSNLNPDDTNAFNFEAHQ